MKYETMEKLEKMACAELDEIAMSGGFSASTAELAKNLVSMCQKIGMMMDGAGRSGDGYWEASGGYGAYRDDGMGGNGMSRRSMRRSRTTGRYMSNGRDEMIDTMDRLMRSGDLSPDEEREAKRFMQMLDKA